MTGIVACGLKQEARIVTAPGLIPVVGGGDVALLEARLEAAVAQGGVRFIVSSGIAGGLDPTLRNGAVVLDGDADLVARMHSLLPDAALGLVIGQDQICATATAKAALRQGPGAVAVDMESHVARRVAARHGLPFAALRIVSDESATDLPPATLVGMRPDGGMALGAVLRSLAGKPSQLPALIRAGRDAGQAFRGLGRAHDALAGIWPRFADDREFPLDVR